MSNNIVKAETSYTLSSKIRDNENNENPHSCQNIQRLIIINKTDNVNEGIIELIKVQKNLSYFEWKDDFEDEYDIINVPYNEILLDIINHLILYFQLLYYQEYQEHKLFEIFPIFHELKTTCGFLEYLERVTLNRKTQKYYRDIS
ncbi:4394_t:CDS:2 [Rhizophagus irregularis]|nr:4394_t:CDS:2 [Rhizophagus irregularis]